MNKYIQKTTKVRNNFELDFDSSDDEEFPEEQIYVECERPCCVDMTKFNLVLHYHNRLIEKYKKRKPEKYKHINSFDDLPVNKKDQYHHQMEMDISNYIKTADYEKMCANWVEYKEIKYRQRSWRYRKIEFNRCISHTLSEGDEECEPNGEHILEISSEQLEFMLDQSRIKLSNVEAAISYAPFEEVVACESPPLLSFSNCVEYSLGNESHSIQSSVGNMNISSAGILPSQEIKRAVDSEDYLNFNACQFSQVTSTQE